MFELEVSKPSTTKTHERGGGLHWFEELNEDYFELAYSHTDAFTGAHLYP